jgi:succinyl-CoA synthetase beta subunit
MRLLEHEAKELFRQAGLAVPRGFVARNLEEVERGLADLKAAEVAVKAQLPAGGRRKAGAVKLVSAHEAARAAADLLARRIEGHEVREVLVEERIAAKEERYLALTLNGTAQAVEALYAPEGGIDVEELAQREGALRRALVRSEEDIARLGAEPEVTEVARRLLRVMRANDAQLVEANPLALTRDGKLVALDAKVLVDDNALYRHPHLRAKELARLPEAERRAAHAELHFVPLEGDVAVIGNGAGLVMSLVDSLAERGARAACFLDLRGGTGADAVRAALDAVTSLEPKVILLVVFGGVTRTDEVAKGLLDFQKEKGLGAKLVVRIRGTNEEKAREMLERKGVHALTELDEAVERAAHLAKEAQRP